MPLPEIIVHQAASARSTTATLIELTKLALQATGGAVALWGAYLAAEKYFSDQEQARQAAAVESRKPFAQKQQEVYLSLVEATATVATRHGQPEWEPAKSRFWILFWGAVPIVADEGVARAVDVFAEALDHPGDAIPLLNASMNLARACRASMGDTWSAGFKPYDASSSRLAELFCRHR